MPKSVFFKTKSFALTPKKEEKGKQYKVFVMNWLHKESLKHNIF